jgi:hypothetical protein
MKFVSQLTLIVSVAVACIGCHAKKPAPPPLAHRYNYEFRGIVDGKCTVGNIGTDAATGKTIVYCLEGSRP